jgi:hypothetical protein
LKAEFDRKRLEDKLHVPDARKEVLWPFWVVFTSKIGVFGCFSNQNPPQNPFFHSKSLKTTIFRLKNPHFPNKNPFFPPQVTVLQLESAESALFTEQRRSTGLLVAVAERDGRLARVLAVLEGVADAFGGGTRR